MYLYTAYIGFGMHYWTIPVASGTNRWQLLYVGSLLYTLLQAVVKLSIVLFLMRIFPSTSFQRLSRVLGTFVILHGVLFLIPYAVQCIPVDSIWDRNITDRKCVNLPAVGYSSSALAIAEDIAILLLPIPQVWRLQISLQRRLALLALFSIGFFACLTSMIRMKFLVQYTNTFDATWDHVDVVMWSFIEQASALLCCSLPAARLFVVNLAASLASKPRSGTRSPDGHDSDRSESQATHQARTDIAPGIRFSQREGHNYSILVTRVFEISWPSTNQRDSSVSTDKLPSLLNPAATHSRRFSVPH
ncbi:integral membrane protein [Colletotrichum limetticola]|uniref:Integral membrane protein n=1 Tax=Colletotrichum limetticola TaxID=1209924 RepID=A0ABQ9PNU2_9PEZI|nr:integral membrane protein [Colletotrichum limetticola]